MTGEHPFGDGLGFMGIGDRKSPTYSLVIRVGNGERLHRVLEPGRRLRVGRDPGVEIFVDDPNVSRTHCELRVEGGRLLLKDSRSLNGTRLNGRLVSEAVLKAEDHIELGQTLLVVGVEDSLEPSTHMMNVSGGPLYEVLHSISIRAEETESSLTSTRIASMRMDHEELKRSYRRLSNAYAKLMSLMSRVANSGRQQTVAQLCERFTSALLESFDTAQAAHVIEVDRRTGHFQTVRAETQTGEVPPKPGPAFDALVRDCIRGRKAISAIERPRGSKGGGCSMMAVPLIQNSEVAGVVFLENAAKAYAFDRFDLDLLTVFGFHMGTSLRCIHLFIELDAAHSRAQRLESGRTEGGRGATQATEPGELRFRALFEQSAFGAAIVHRDSGKIIEANDGFVRMLGFGRAELQKLQFRDLFPDPADADSLLEPLDTALNDNQRITEATMRTGSGEPLSVIGGARRMAFGSSPVVLCYFVDVSASKRQEAELLTSLRRITRLSQFSSALMAIKDPGTIYEQIVGHVVEELKVDMIVVALWDQETGTLQPVVARIRRLGQLVPETQLQPVSPAGAVRDVVETREPAMETLSPRDTNYPNPLLPVTSVPPCRSRLFVPLAVRDSLIGVLSVQCGESNAYDSAQLGFLLSIATLAALAINSARLYQETLTQQEDLARLSDQLITAQEDERARISRELHDGVGQSLTALRYQLGTLKTMAKGIAGSEALQNELNESLTLVRNLIEELRTISLDLRPTMLDDLGLAPTLEWLVRQFEQRHGSKVVASIDLGPDPIPPAVATAAFRVSQEALANAAKHAGAATLFFRAKVQGGALHIEIEDDGKGFDTAKLRDIQVARACSGIINMKERARLLGGEFALQSEPNKGTRLSFAFPLQERIAP
jgi:PAS domain S-box-containing protein